MSYYCHLIIEVDWENGHFYEEGMEQLMKSSTFFFEFLPKLESGYQSLVKTVEAGGITTICDLLFPMFSEELEIRMANTVLNASEESPLFTTFAVPNSRLYLAKNGSHKLGLANIRKTAKEVRMMKLKFLKYLERTKILLSICIQLTEYKSLKIYRLVARNL